MIHNSNAKNEPILLNELASIYEIGKGVKKDIDKAVELYTKATKLKNPEALKKLTLLSDKDITALSNLIEMYIEGDGVEKNIKKAEDLIPKRSLKGNSLSSFT
jgi:TPR repeat protein